MVLTGILSDRSFEIAQGDDKDRIKHIFNVGYGYDFHVLQLTNFICIRALKPKFNLVYHKCSKLPKGKVCYIRCVIGQNDDDNDSEYWIEIDFVVSEPLN